MTSEYSNKTSVPLAAGQTFTTNWIPYLGYETITLTRISDQASAVGGDLFELSPDGGITIFPTAGGTYTDVNNFATSTIGTSKGTHVRYTYTNGPIAQTMFFTGIRMNAVAVTGTTTNVWANTAVSQQAQLTKSILIVPSSTVINSPMGMVTRTAGSLNVNVTSPAALPSNAATETTLASIKAKTDNLDVLLSTRTSPLDIQSVSVQPVSGFIASGQVSLTTVGLEQAVRNTAYVEPSTNAQRSVSSGNPADTAAGTGARQIKITYLDQTGAGPFSENLTLLDGTPVNTVATNICFIEKIEVIQVGSGGVNAGIITMFASTAGLGGAIASIAAGANRTQWCSHYVPISKFCRISSQTVGSISNAANSACSLVLKSKTLVLTNQVDQVLTDMLRAGGGQAGTAIRQYSNMPVVAGPARITGYITPDIGTTISYLGSFSFYDS